MKNIFIACAHLEEAPLPELLEEGRSLKGILDPLKERGILSLQLNRAANVDDIFETFSKEEIHVFHYSGHADENTLYLEEGGNIKGIASLFGLAKESEEGDHNPLKFVFLNGCSSKGQVESLHKAGVSAVIATSRPIGDATARVFAEHFYKTWVMESKTLKYAFDVAKSRVHSIDGEENRTIDFGQLNVESGDFKDEISWGLYIHSEAPSDIENWQLNEPVQLPQMYLEKIKPNTSQSLRELVSEFQKNNRKAQQEIRKGRKDPLMTLIEHLPWIIGTHLRRLFAVEEDGSMTAPEIPRLKELIIAYQELTRFICYLSLSLMWDAKEEGFEIEPLPFSIIPTEDELEKIDYVYRTRKYFEILAKIENLDPLGLEDNIEVYLETIDDPEELQSGYRLMEEWKQALASSPEQFEQLVLSRTNSQNKVEDLVLQAEAIYADFLRNCLFLADYRLLTVRSIVVDKLRHLKAERPFSHYTMSLHAAFSQLDISLIGRETPTDNYCLLLTMGGDEGGDLDYALNLSPFYVDRSSFVGKGTDNYPAVFAIEFVRAVKKKKEYIYRYIDIDINHDYTFKEDNTLVIDSYGAVLPSHIEVDPTSLERFEQIHQQLILIEKDIPHKVQS